MKILKEKQYPYPNKLYNLSDNKALWLDDAEDFIYWGSEADKWAEDYAKSYKVKMSPKDFLDLTTIEGADSLKVGGYIGGSRLRELDIDELNKEKWQTIFLQVAFPDAGDPTKGEVVGHEGRHRMFALMNAGVKEVDVELKCDVYGSVYNKYRPFTPSYIDLTGQFDDSVKVRVNNPIPLSWKTHKSIRPNLKEDYVYNGINFNFTLDQLYTILCKELEGLRSKLDCVNHLLDIFPDLKTNVVLEIYDKTATGEDLDKEWWSNFTNLVNGEDSDYAMELRELNPEILRSVIPEDEDDFLESLGNDTQPAYSTAEVMPDGTLVKQYGLTYKTDNPLIHDYSAQINLFDKDLTKEQFKSIKDRISLYLDEFGYVLLRYKFDDYLNNVLYEAKPDSFSNAVFSNTLYNPDEIRQGNFTPGDVIKDIKDHLDYNYIESLHESLDESVVSYLRNYEEFQRGLDRGNIYSGYLGYSGIIICCETEDDENDSSNKKVFNQDNGYIYFENAHPIILLPDKILSDQYEALKIVIDYHLNIASYVKVKDINGNIMIFELFKDAYYEDTGEEYTDTIYVGNKRNASEYIFYCIEEMIDSDSDVFLEKVDKLDSKYYPLYFIFKTEEDYKKGGPALRTASRITAFDAYNKYNYYCVIGFNTNSDNDILAIREKDTFIESYPHFCYVKVLDKEKWTQVDQKHNDDNIFDHYDAIAFIHDDRCDIDIFNKDLNSSQRTSLYNFIASEIPYKKIIIDICVVDGDSYESIRTIKRDHVKYNIDGYEAAADIMKNIFESDTFLEAKKERTIDDVAKDLSSYDTVYRLINDGGKEKELSRNLLWKTILSEIYNKNKEEDKINFLDDLYPGISRSVAKEILDFFDKALKKKVSFEDFHKSRLSCLGTNVYYIYDLMKHYDKDEYIEKLQEKIVKLPNGKWQVQSEDGSKNLGTYNTEEEAKKRLQQVHYFKNKNEDFSNIDIPSNPRYMTDEELKEYLLKALEGKNEKEGVEILHNIFPKVDINEKDNQGLNALQSLYRHLKDGFIYKNCHLIADWYKGYNRSVINMKYLQNLVDKDEYLEDFDNPDYYLGIPADKTISRSDYNIVEVGNDELKDYFENRHKKDGYLYFSTAVKTNGHEIYHLAIGITLDRSVKYMNKGNILHFIFIKGEPIARIIDVPEEETFIESVSKKDIIPVTLYSINKYFYDPRGNLYYKSKNDNKYYLIADFNFSNVKDAIKNGVEIIYIPGGALDPFSLNDLEKDEYIENINESLLLEKTRQQLIDKSKASDKYKAKDRAGENRWTRRNKSHIANTVRDYNKIDMDAFFKADILDFVVNVRGETNDYQVIITFENALRSIKDNIKRNNGKLEFKCILRALIEAFNRGDVYVHCSCPDFTYRQAYWATRGGYNSGTPQPSNGKMIANPNDTKGAGCKHVNLVLGNLDWMMKISSVINNYIYWARDNLEWQYAKYIFPELYGMSYDKAIQMTIDMYDETGELKPEYTDDTLRSDEDIINMSNMIGKQRGQYKKKPEKSINPRYSEVHPKKEEPEEETNELGLELGDENEEPELDMEAEEQI